jgi:glycosyltransferase involved in cell wall biosynthesis
MSSLVEKSVSIIIKTFERRQCVELLYRSIRRFYPNIPVIIADDSRNPLDALGDAKIIRLPFNSGVCHGRNAALAEVSTKYFVTADDDFVFTRHSDLSIPYNILETTDFDIVGMDLLYDGWKNRIYRGSYEKKEGLLFQYQNKPYAYHQGYPAYHYILQCFMARTNLIQLSPWDEQFKVAFEHDDFFLRLKEKKTLITHVNTASIDHYPELQGEYMKYRERTDPDKMRFLNKHRITGVKEMGRGFPYWQRKLDSFLKFIKLRNAVNTMLKKHRLKGSGLL